MGRKEEITSSITILLLVECSGFFLVYVKIALKVKKNYLIIQANSLLNILYDYLSCVSLDKNIGNSQKDYVEFYYKTGLFRGNEYIWRNKET